MRSDAGTSRIPAGSAETATPGGGPATKIGVEPEARASFQTMEESTERDGQVIVSHFAPFAKSLPDRVLAHLRLRDGDFGGFPVDRLTHSLPTLLAGSRGKEGG